MNKEDKYLQFVKTSETNTDLYVYGDIRKKDIIDRWFGDDETRVDAMTFVDALNQVDTPNLTVHINSYGGSVSEGLAIYSVLSQFKGHLVTIVDGFACSAASVIFMAGKERIVPESGLLMIHNAWSNAEGDSNALRKVADDLEKITQPSVDIYCLKTGLPEEKIKELMDAETWITSKEAFEMNFSTSMSKDSQAKQSLESNYVYNLVMKIKKYEKKINSLEKEQPKQSDWDAFFNGKREI